MDTREWPVSCFPSCLVSSSPGSSHANSRKTERCACVLGSMIFIWEHPEPRIPAAFVSPALRKKSHCAYKLNAAETSYCEKLHRGVYYINSVPCHSTPRYASGPAFGHVLLSQGWQRCPLCLCRCTSAWTPLRKQLGNGCQEHRYGPGCSSGPRPGAPLPWVPWGVSQAGRVLEHAGGPESPSSCTSLEVVVPKAICPLRLGVTPVVYRLCEQLLSWKSSSCIPRRAAGGRVGAAPPGVGGAGSRVRPDQPRSWQQNVAFMAAERGAPRRAAGRPAGRLSAAPAARPARCCVCCVREQPVQRAAALQLSVGPIPRSGVLLSSVTCAQMSNRVGHEALSGLSDLPPDCS